MDREHRPGGKTGSGPISDSALSAARKERQRQLALESIDITKVLIFSYYLFRILIL